MGKILGHLKPQGIWNHFEEITKHPRPSKQEEKVVDYVFSVGKRLNLETLKDDFGNVIIKKPASKGKENLKTVILQGHLDMVCEKNRGIEHDFENDPLDIYIDGDWVRAKGTTLGADNGIGVAAALAVLEDNTLEHGPIECLFTLDEETGLTGANNLDTKILNGTILLNLDSEEEGTIYIGCAGGRNSEAEIPLKLENVPANYKTFEIKVAGMQGGHSGIEINKGRGNAVKVLTRALKGAESYGLKLADIEGGNKHNAIPREAFAVVAVPNDKVQAFKAYVAEYDKTVKEELASVEKTIEVSVEDYADVKQVMDAESQKRVILALYAAPHGVIKMSADIPDFVETSTNLATVKTNGNKVKVVTSQRSSVGSEIVDASNMVSSVFELAGATIKYAEGYPGWKPDPNSEILGVVVNSYKKLFNKEPEVKAIHAGLECGIISEKYPGMDMVSFGPTMIGVHSPDEKLSISSIPLFWETLTTILKNIPAKN